MTDSQSSPSSLVALAAGITSSVLAASARLVVPVVIAVLLVSVLMAAGFSSGQVALAAEAGSDSTLPQLAGIREEVVLSGMVVNGNVLELTRFKDHRPAALLLAEVTRIWSQRPAPVQSSTSDGRLTLTQLVDDSVEVFEVSTPPSRHGTQGRRIRWRRGAPSPMAVDSGAWLERVLPTGSRVLDRVANLDGKRRLTTLVAATQASSASTWQFLSSELARNGFRPEQRLAPSLHGGGVARFFTRGSEDLAVTISEHDGQRAIVFHHGTSGQ